jgi:hypothetical protein
MINSFSLIAFFIADGEGRHFEKINVEREINFNRFLLIFWGPRNAR